MADDGAGVREHVVAELRGPDGELKAKSEAKSEETQR